MCPRCDHKAPGLIFPASSALYRSQCRPFPAAKVIMRLGHHFLPVSCVVRPTVGRSPWTAPGPLTRPWSFYILRLRERMNQSFHGVRWERGSSQPPERGARKPQPSKRSAGLPRCLWQTCGFFRQSAAPSHPARSFGFVSSIWNLETWQPGSQSARVRSRDPWPKLACY
jgi:hypothetical protein